MFQASGNGACFFSEIPLFRMMCVKYFVAICESFSINLWTLGVGIWRSWRCLVVVVCIVPFIPTVMMMCSGTSHPDWDRRGSRLCRLLLA